MSTGEPAAAEGRARLDQRSRAHPRRAGAAADARRAGAGRRRHPRRGDRGHPGQQGGAPSRTARPAPVPEPSEVEVPGALAQEIRRAMKRYPRERSAAIPALWAVQRRYGWCTPEGIEQAAAVMGVTPGYLRVGRELLRPLPPGARGRAPGAGLHQHQLLAARRRRPARGFGEAAGVDGQGDLRGRQGLRARLRVPRRLRPRADGLDRRALLRAAHRGRRGDGGRAAAQEARRSCPRSAFRTGRRRRRERAAAATSASPAIRSTRAAGRSAKAEGRRRRADGAPRRRGSSSATSTSPGSPRSRPTASSAATRRSARPMRR